MGPLQTIYPATTITVPLDPTTFSFKQVGLWNPTELIDHDYVRGTWPFDTAAPDYLSSITGTSGANWSVSGGLLLVPGATGSTASGFNSKFTWEAPAFAITVPVLTVWGTGTTALMTLGVSDGYTGSSRNSVQLRWDRVAGTVAVATVTSGGTVTALGSAGFTPPSTPFELGFSVTGMSAVASVRPLGGSWATISKGTIPDGGTFDLRVPANLNALNVMQLETSAEGNNATTLTLGPVKYGYVDGLSGNYTHNCVRTTDGTPIQSGGEQFITSAVVGPSASEDQSVASAMFSILAVNPLKNSIRTQAKIFVLRGGKIYGENGGACVYDPTTSEFVYLIPNWGDYRNQTNLCEIQIYMYRRMGFPSGVIVLTDGESMKAGLPTTTSAYDPDIIYYGGLYHLVYTRTSTLTPPWSFSSAHVTSPTLSASATWTQVALQSLGTKEGAKWLKSGDTRYIIQVDNTAQNQVVADEDLNTLGTFVHPAGTSIDIVMGHACLLNYRDGAKDRIFWYYFDGLRRDDLEYAWGRIHLLENIAQQTGHDYAWVTMLDIADPVIGAGAAPGSFFRRW